MRLCVAVAGVCLALSVAGCSSHQSGSAAPTTLTDAQLYDPCTLPDSAIQAAGFDPSTKDTNAFLGRQGFKGCGWSLSDGSHYLDVDTTTHTLDEVKANTSFKGVHPVNVPGRQAVQYTEQGNSCGIDFSTSKGVVEVLARNVDMENGNAESLCPVALKAATALSPSLPQ